MGLLLVALLTQAPVVLEARSAHLLPAPLGQPQVEPERATFSLSDKLSAPVIGLFAEFFGASIALMSVQGPLFAATGLPRRTLQIAVIPGAILSTAVLGAASAVGVRGWLKRPDIELPIRPMWICGSASMAIAAIVGVVIGLFTGAPLIGLLYGLAAGAVAAPVIQTYVATRSAKVRPAPSRTAATF